MASVHLFPTPSARVLALDEVEEPAPPARLDARFNLAPGRRSVLRRVQQGHRGSVDPQIGAVLVQRPDLIGGDEALDVAGSDHEPVEDVLGERRDHVVDRAHLLAT